MHPAPRVRPLRLHPLALPRAPTPSPVDTYLARMGSAASRSALGYCLTDLTRRLTGRLVTNPRLLNWSALRYADTVGVLGQLAIEGKAVSTRRLARVALHGVLKECWRLELMTAEDYQRAIDTPSPKGKPLPAGRALNVAESAALWAVVLQDAARLTGLRNAAMLALFYATGCRRNELLSLELRDYEPTSGRVAIRHGKGGKQRYAYVDDARLRALLARWLAARGDAPGPLICGTDRYGHVHVRRLDNCTPGAVLVDLCRRAGVACIAPHDLRRTAASIVGATEPLDTVQQFLGHADISTTALYVRREGDTVRRAAGRIRLPD